MQTSDVLFANFRSQLRQELVEEIRAEVRTELLANLTDRLGASVAAKANGTKVAPKVVAKPKAPRVRKGAKRSPEQLAKMCDQVLAVVKKTPNVGAEQIKTELGVKLEDIQLPIAKLLASKALKKKGEKRATRYSAN